MTPTRKVSHLRLAGDDVPPVTQGPAPAARRLRDREWIVRVRAGDELALTAIFNEYYASLTFHAEAILHSHDAALDVVADVFQTLWVKREQLDPVGLWPYLLTATRNRALDALERRHLEEKTAERFRVAGIAPEMGTTGLESPDDHLLDHEEAQERAAKVAKIESAYGALPPRSREVFELWAGGMTYREIGHTLGVALKTVDAHLLQAKRVLRRLFVNATGAHGG